MYYVYIYLDPRKTEYTLSTGERLDHEPFYVGKGKGKRAWYHLDPSSRGNNSLKKNKIKRIIDAGYIPEIKFVAVDLDETDAMKLEQDWITAIGTKWTIHGIKRGPLCNMTSGGDGYTPCDDLRALQSVRSAGENNPMYGKTHTSEARRKISTQSKKLKHSDDTKARMASKRKGADNPRAMQWTVMFPDGSTLKVDDLKLFCRQHGLNYNTLYNTSINKKPVTRGIATGYRLFGLT